MCVVIQYGTNIIITFPTYKYTNVICVLSDLTRLNVVEKFVTELSNSYIRDFVGEKIMALFIIYANPVRRKTTVVK